MLYNMKNYVVKNTQAVVHVHIALVSSKHFPDPKFKEYLPMQ